MLTATEIKVITNALIQAKIDLEKYQPTGITRELEEKKIRWCESKLKGNSDGRGAVFPF